MDRPAPADTTESGIAVLYVDDDDGLARLVARALRRQGYRVETAPGVPEALDRLACDRFDVVAVDHFMPGLDGMQFLEALRGLDDPPPAIYVTASDEGRLAVAALKTGAVDYVIKDVQGAFLDLLDRAIGQAVENARARKAKEAAERELRESRDRLAALLEQKTVLLHEVGHRVSNSLQLISSMISLQAARLSDPAARDALQQTRERVQAVMLVHRRLYTSDEVSAIEVGKYLQAMLEELETSVLAEDRGIRIEVSADPLLLGPDKAVSLGVIVSELVMNALKYAFPEGGGGTIRVGLRVGETGVLTVDDDGVGCPVDTAPQGTGLGTLIVGAMAKTLQATIDRPPGTGGCRLIVTFPLA